MGFWRSAGATLVLPVLLAACAGEPPDGRTRSDASAATTHQVVSVRVVVSGGITGTREVHTVSRNAPPGAVAAARLDRILALAASPAVRRFAGDGPTRTGVPCCDQQVFAVTIENADGTRSHITTSQTTPVPPELRRLLRLMAAV